MAGVFFSLALAAAATAFAVRPAPRAVWLPGVVYREAVGSKLVALTYDDGPQPVVTPRLLDLLDRYHAKATFFMIGTQMEKYPDVVREVARRGHAIGNHTYSHPYDLRRYSQDRVNRELDACEATLHRLGGPHTHLFRPPRGWASPAMVAAIRRKGYEIVLWSVSADHEDAPTPRDMANRVFRQVQPGAIILLHDGKTDARTKDVEATALILAGLQRKGYRFVTVPQLLQSAKRGGRRREEGVESNGPGSGE